MICATEDHLSCSSPKAYRTREARMPENLEVGILRTFLLILPQLMQLLMQLYDTKRQLLDTIRKLRDASKIPINYPSQLHSSDQQKEDNQQQAKNGHFSAISSTMNKDIGFMYPSMALCPDWQQIEHSILHYNPNGMESLRIAPPYYDVPCKFCTFKKKNCLKSTKIQTKLDDMIWYTQIGKKEKFLEIWIYSSDQQKEDNQQQAKSGHFSTTSGKMPLFRPFEHQKILHNNPNGVEPTIFLDVDSPNHVNEYFLKPFKHSMQEKLTSQGFPRDDDASCRLAGMIVVLVASLLWLNVEHLLLSTPPLFIWLMLVFIWLGIVSGISVVLLWLLRLPKKQSLLLLIAILSTIGSYACAIAVVLPFEWLRAPFLAVAISGLIVYLFLQLKQGKLSP